MTISDIFPVHALRKEYASEGEADRSDFERGSLRKMADAHRKVEGIGPTTREGMPVTLRSVSYLLNGEPSMQIILIIIIPFANKTIFEMGLNRVYLFLQTNVSRSLFGNTNISYLDPRK